MLNKKSGARTAGLIHPTGLLPIARRASLTAERIAAKAGADADVPETSLNWPSIATEKFKL